MGVKLIVQQPQKTLQLTDTQQLLETGKTPYENSYETLLKERNDFAVPARLSAFALFKTRQYPTRKERS